MNPATWSVAIFTAREGADVLARTITAVGVAVRGHPTTIDVLVDGNEAAANDVASRDLALPDDATVRLWSVPWRDKACAWNRYVHEIAPAADVAFFVDGYVRPKPDSCATIADALAANPSAWAATGVPSAGPSAAGQRTALLAEGGLHGNLYALAGGALARLKARGFRLPLGIYRNDSLLGAVIAFGADPAGERWDATRIAVVPAATWDREEAAANGADRVRQFAKRRLRQAQGDLEIAAFREHMAIHRRPVEALPRTTAELVAGRSPTARTRGGPFARALAWWVGRRLDTGADWSRCDAPARLVRTWSRDTDAR
jgi:hypothetical protein